METQDYRNYLVHSKTEILFILRALQRKGALVSAYFNQSNDFLLTSLLAVDEQGLTIDVGADPEANRRALASAALFLVTSHERVKIQFSTKGVSVVTHEGRPAFRTGLPETLLRLERREYYRLTTSVAVPLTCLIPVRRRDGSVRTLEVDVVDISCSGVAVVVPPEGVLFEPEMRFENCRIDLRDAGTVKMTLQVRNMFEVTLRNGERLRRAGCQFLDMPSAMTAMIQQYITEVDRQRRAAEKRER